jgi:class 3 adenylate cyclase
LALKDFLQTLDDEVATVLDSSFEIEVIETAYVPSFDDPNITYDNLDTQKKKCKLLESCVLYVDIRDSAKISAAKQPKTLAKMYSSFVRSMIACARYYGGHVRNIIGDRVMVVFDKEDCFKKAADTAVLMNSVSRYILNKRIKSTDFKCGIGIDYGKMLITKSGAIRHGAEKEFYRTLVWLGKPANTASRLTDMAFKTQTWSVPGVRRGNYYPYLKEWLWWDETYEKFIDELEPTLSRLLKHKDENFCSFYETSLGPYTETHSQILMTKDVFDGLSSSHPQSDYIQNKLFKKKNINIRDYDGEVYGGDVTFTVAKEI